MTYQTTPGTLPHRAIEYLKSRAPGTELSTPVFVDILGADIAGFSTSLANCLRAGLLKATTKPGNRRMLFWSLSDGVPVAAADTDDEADDQPPVQRVVPAAAAAVEMAWPKPSYDRARLLEGGAESKAEVEPAPVAFFVTERSDGTMTIQQGGLVLVLDQQEAAVLCAFVGRRVA